MRLRTQAEGARAERQRQAQRERDAVGAEASPCLLPTNLPLFRAAIQLDEAIGRYKSHLRAMARRQGGHEGYRTGDVGARDRWPKGAAALPR
jgi:hypothetical protein